MNSGVQYTIGVFLLENTCVFTGHLQSGFRVFRSVWGLPLLTHQSVAQLPTCFSAQSALFMWTSEWHFFARSRSYSLCHVPCSFDDFMMRIALGPPHFSDPLSPVRQKLGSLHPWDFSIRQASATMWIRRGVVWDSEDGNGWFSQCLPCSYDLRNKCLLLGRSEKWLVPLSPLALEIIKVHGLNLSSVLPIFQSCFPPVSATSHEISWKFKF